MAYSDLLAQQQKELERLNQEYYADHVTIKKLQDEHYDKTRHDGQLDRLKEGFERKVKEVRYTQSIDVISNVGRWGPSDIKVG